MLSLANTRGSRQVRTAIMGTVGVLAWFAVWQWVTTGGPLTNVVGIPTATDTLRTATDLATDAHFWTQVGQSFAVALIGLAIALLIGLVVGIATGLSDVANDLLDPLVQFLRPVPPVVILPLILLIVGPTDTLAVILATIGALWPILVQVHIGVRDVDPVALDTARSMTLSWRATQTNIVLPSALPYIATGVRIAASLALMLSIGAGILGGSPGFGQAISTAQQTGQSATVFAMLLWAGVLGITLNGCLALLETRLIHGRRPEATS